MPATPDHRPAPNGPTGTTWDDVRAHLAATGPAANAAAYRDAVARLAAAPTATHPRARLSAQLADAGRQLRRLEPHELPPVPVALADAWRAADRVSTCPTLPPTP